MQSSFCNPILKILRRIDYYRENTCLEKKLEQTETAVELQSASLLLKSVEQAEEPRQMYLYFLLCFQVLFPTVWWEMSRWFWPGTLQLLIVPMREATKWPKAWNQESGIETKYLKRYVLSA